MGCDNVFLDRFKQELLRYHYKFQRQRAYNLTKTLTYSINRLIKSDMQVDENHRLSGCNWSPSRHFDERPLRQDIELIVLHCISLPEGKFGHGYPEQLFLGTLKTEDHRSFSDLKGLRVAPHFFIDLKGNATQFVPFDKRAWHAGVSSWRGRSNCNDFSIVLYTIFTP